MITLIKDQLESLVLNFSATMPFHQSLPLDTDGTEGTWYIPPLQHALELVFVTVLCAYLIYYGLKVILSKKSSYVDQTSQYQKLNQNPSLLEFLTTLSVIVSYCFMFLHKYQRNQVTYVFQFCHFNLGLLLFCLICPKKYFLPHLIYNINLYFVYGTIMALVSPDTRGIELFFEMGNFYLEHYLLLFVPFIMLFSGRYAVWRPNLPTLLLSLSAKYLLICIFSTIVGLKLGTNLNYALSPPPSFLESFGSYFKLFFMVLSILLMTFSRLIIIPSGYLFVKFISKLVFTFKKFKNNSNNHIELKKSD